MFCHYSRDLPPTKWVSQFMLQPSKSGRLRFERIIRVVSDIVGNTTVNTAPGSISHE
jgi:hypothetical protein